MVKVEIFYVIIGLVLGFLIVYFTMPPARIILKYPTLDNMQNTVYSKNNQCYKFNPVEVSC